MPQNQFKTGDRVTILSGPYEGGIGIVRRVHAFGFGAKPFEVERPDGTATDRYDHGELAEPSSQSQPEYGRPR